MNATLNKSKFVGVCQLYDGFILDTCHMRIDLAEIMFPRKKGKRCGSTETTPENDGASPARLHRVIVNPPDLRPSKLHVNACLWIYRANGL